jgi:type III secretion system FlhB-like substrate exporter
VAERIVALAEEYGVVIETNPALAEALSGVPLDDTIPLELYEAVAIVIGYVLQVSSKK